MYQVQMTCVCGKKYWPNQSWMHTGCDPSVNDNRTVTVVNNADDAVVNESRQVKWQKANRDRYNEKMREYMRKRRG